MYHRVSQLLLSQLQIYPSALWFGGWDPANNIFLLNSSSLLSSNRLLGDTARLEEERWKSFSYLLPVPTSGILAKLLNSGSGNIFPFQQLNKFAVAQHLQNLSYYPFFRNTSTKLPSVPYSQVWIPNSLGCSSEFRDPSTCQAAPLLQRSEFQLHLAPPLSFCVLIISASSLCSFGPRVITVSAIRTSISSISFYFFSYVINNPLY